jgi:hypothetical protein
MIDEISLYSRGLSASEVKAIYDAGSAGKFDSSASAPENLAKASFEMDGNAPEILFGNNTNWQTNTVTFTPTSSSVTVRLSGLEPGLLLDSFTLTENAAETAVFPEESLKDLVGDMSGGEWKLELWDNRAGPATNPAPELISWQLRFILENNTPVATQLFNEIPVTNTIPSCSTAYYFVDVPTWADYATNRLLFATAPGVNVWFNPTNFPTGTNAGDILLIPPTTPPPSLGGSFTMTTNSTPPLIPGSRYYLAVENPCGSATNVTYAIEMDLGLDAIVLTNMVPYSGTNSGGTNIDQYYVYTVSTNAARAQFEINHPEGQMVLVASKGLPPPTSSVFDYNSANPSTNDQLIVVLTNSEPVELSAGQWYLAAINVSGGPVAYSIMASEWPVTGRPFGITNTMADTNSFCMTWNSLEGVHYYIQGKPELTDSNWFKATTTLTATNDFTTQCIELPSPFQFFRVAEGLALVDVPEPPPEITAGIATNGIALKWIDSVTARYQVQWATNLPPVTWNSFTNEITTTNGWFQFLDDGTQSGGLGGTRFYRLNQLLPLVNP